MRLPKNILAPTDFSPLSQIAVEAAFALARRSDGHVHLVHVLTPMPSYQLALSGVHLAEIVEEERRAAASKLEAMAPRGAPFTCSTLYGFPSRELALAIESTKSDLVVIATHAHGVIRRALLGSVASALVRTSKVPVLVVGDARRSVEFRSVVAGVDLSPATRDVVELARSFVHPDGQVEIVSVVETAMLAAAGVTSPVLRAELDRLIDARKGAIREIVPHDAGPLTHVEVIERATGAAQGLLDVAAEHNADLIVVGTSGHNFWQRAMLGSTANRVLSNATCPVLVVPHAGV